MRSFPSWLSAGSPAASSITSSLRRSTGMRVIDSV